MIIAYCCVCVCRHPCRWNTCWTKASVKSQNTQILILQLWDLKNSAVSEHLVKLFLHLSPCDATVNGAEESTAAQDDRKYHSRNEDWSQRLWWEPDAVPSRDDSCVRTCLADIWTIKTGTGSPGGCQIHISLLLSLQRTGVHTWFPTNGSEIKASLV